MSPSHTPPSRKPLVCKALAWRRLLGLALLAAAGMAEAQSRAENRAEQRVLRVPAVQSWSAPYALYRDGAPVAGINHDIVQALAEHLGMSLQTLVLPRTRVDGAVTAGELDLRCHLSPDWVRAPETYSWSPPLFELATVLVGHESAVPVSHLDQLHRGQTVGTVLGFVYPGLEERFSDGRLRRDDTFAVDRNLQKLKLIRSPYAVADTREIAWHLRQDSGHQFAAWRLPITRTDYRCAVPRNGRIEASLLLAGFERLLANGQIERIVRNYSPPQPVLVMAANSSVQQLSRQQISALFMGEVLELPGGGRVALGSLGGALRQEFFSQVLEKDAAQLKAIWSRMTFSGRGRAPREFSTAAALRAWLVSTPNALAFLDSSSLDPTLKVVYMPTPASAASP